MKLAQAFTFNRLLVLLFILQALFVLQIVLIWNISSELGKRRREAQKAQQAQVEKEEEVITPGGVRGL